MATDSTISLIHPDFYNRAFKALGVTDLTAHEKNGQMRVSVGDGAIGQVSNALATAFTKLLAAESQVALLRGALGNIGQARGLRDWGELDEAVEQIEQAIGNLERISREA